MNISSSVPADIPQINASRLSDMKTALQIQEQAVEIAKAANTAVSPSSRGQIIDKEI